MKSYRRSEDYVLADKLLRVSGEPLAAWLTDADDITTFRLLSYGNDGLCIDGKLQPLIQFQTNFFDYCEVVHAQFLLPVFEDDAPKVDLPKFIDRVATLECALSDVAKESRDRYEKIVELELQSELLKQSFDAAVESVKLRDITIEGLQAALELTNEKYAECDQKCGDLAEMLGNRDRELKDLKADFVAMHEKYTECEKALGLANQKIVNRTTEIRELSDLRDSNNSDNRKIINNRESEIASLKLSLGVIASRLGVTYDPDFLFPLNKVVDAIWHILNGKAIEDEDHTLAPYYRGILDKLCDRLNLHTAGAFDDLVYTVDRISIDCIQFSEGIIERDCTISNLKLELEQCKRQSQINDELRSEAGVTLESYQNVLDELRSLFNLPLKRNYLDLVSHVQELQNWVKDYDSNLSHFSETISDRDRTIAILEENLERAESNHLEQLRAIVQMLEPIKEDEYHFGNIYTAGALKLVVTVVQNNINRLDPTGF